MVGPQARIDDPISWDFIKRQEFRPETLVEYHRLDKEARLVNSFGIAFKTYRDLIISEGEWKFEQLRGFFPFYIESNMPKDPIASTKYMNQRKLWLSSQFDREVYEPYPENFAIGKYKHLWRGIHFRNKADAALFKLTWHGRDSY